MLERPCCVYDVNVKAFGATGDGATDDTAAIQNAIAIATGRGTTVFFPEGDYVVMKSLEATHARAPLRITGVGPGSRLINLAGGPSLHMNAKGAFEITDLAIVGRAGHRGDAILISGRSGYGRIRNLHLYPNGNGIHLRNTNDVIIENVWYWMGSDSPLGATLDPGANRHAVLADGTEAVNAVHVRNVWSTGYANDEDGGAAIRFAPRDVSQNISITACDFEGNGRKVAIDLRNLTDFSIRGNFLANTEIRIAASSRGHIGDNHGGAYVLGDGTKDGSCRNILAESTGGHSFFADEHCDAVGAINSDFGGGGYRNLGANGIALNVAGDPGFGNRLILNYVGDRGVAERHRTVAMGDWVSPEHDPSAFSASTGSWTVTTKPENYSYTLVGNTMTLCFFISNACVKGAPIELRVRIPDGHRPKRRIWARGLCALDGGAHTDLTVEAFPGKDFVGLYPGLTPGALTWPDTAKNFVTASITFEIE